MFGELNKHFEIFIPDLLGFGSSGRPEFLCRTTEETAEYFVVCLRKWMDKTGFESEGPYSIIAHSLGCWVASLFAVLYPQNILQMMFLSPACMAKPKPDFCPLRFIQRYESLGKRMLFRLAYMSWGKHYSPAIVFKLPGKSWAWFLHRQWAARIKCNDKSKKEKLSKIIMQVCMRHSTADRCIDMACEFGGDARISI